MDLDKGPFFVYFTLMEVNKKMKKEDKEKQRKADLIRAPRPKQRCQAFRDRTKYNRKSKGVKLDPLSFCPLLLI